MPPEERGPHMVARREETPTVHSSGELEARGKGSSLTNGDSPLVPLVLFLVPRDVV
jgi:hypothetical protein